MTPCEREEEEEEEDSLDLHPGHVFNGKDRVYRKKGKAPCFLFLSSPRVRNYRDPLYRFRISERRWERKLARKKPLSISTNVIHEWHRSMERESGSNESTSASRASLSSPFARVTGRRERKREGNGAPFTRNISTRGEKHRSFVQQLLLSLVESKGWLESKRISFYIRSACIWKFNSID